MTKPLSVRFPEPLYRRLKDHARRDSVPASALVQRYVDEGLRSDLHPGIVFRGGPAGRRAALAGGPDVWEIASLVRHLGVRGKRAISAASEASGLPEEKIRAAVAYWADFPEEIDAWIEEAERASQAAERRLETEQKLLG